MLSGACGSQIVTAKSEVLVDFCTQIVRADPDGIQLTDMICLLIKLDGLLQSRTTPLFTIRVNVKNYSLISFPCSPDTCAIFSVR